MDSHRDEAPAAETPLVAAVRATVRRHALLASGEHVLVAVSGGPDSVALLHVLRLLQPGLGLQLSVCHVHHGLRPAADQDAEFVRGLAARLECPVTVERVVVPLGAGRSLEESARAVRYAALRRVARESGAVRIALGHTADDQAETVLMRVVQGAGPRGLAGIPVRRGRLVRPLLEVDRATVLAHLGAHGLPFVEDATNRDPKLLRNRIRHEVLPLLAAHGWPRIAAALRRTGRAARETVQALDVLLAPYAAGLVRPAVGGFTLDVARLSALPPGAVKALIRQALGSLAGVAGGSSLAAGLRAHHLDALAALLEARVGARVRLAGGLAVERGRDALWVTPPAGPAVVVPLAAPGETRIPGAGIVLRAELGPPQSRVASAAPPDPAREAWFDPAALPGPVRVRARRPGDRVVPFGAQRAVRVAGLLAAAGVARGARDRWPLLVSGEGEAAEEAVLWVIGVRRGSPAPVTRETRSVLRIRAVVDPTWDPSRLSREEPP